MATMDKKQIETQYNSYEDIAKAFSSPGSQCTEIYLCVHSTSDKPSPYVIVHSRAESEAMFASPNIAEVNLAWSKSGGALIPYKSVS